MSELIRVVVVGGLGRAGRTAAEILHQEAGIELAGVVDILVRGDSLEMADGRSVPAATNLETLLETIEAHVVVEFTAPAIALTVARLAATRGLHVVCGSTGFTEQQMDELARLADRAGVGILSGTMSFGVALVSRLAAVAAPYFQNAEIVDMGKLEKQDHPSGAALDFARAMLGARGGEPFGEAPSPDNGFRGGTVHGVRVHSLRLSDAYIHQQIILASKAGTMVTIGCELTSEKYMHPGIVIAVREAVKHRGFLYGLEDIFLRLEGEWTGSI